MNVIFRELTAPVDDLDDDLAVPVQDEEEEVGLVDFELMGRCILRTDLLVQKPSQKSIFQFIIPGGTDRRRRSGRRSGR